MSLSGNPTVFGIDPYNISATPVHPLGAKGISADGRKFRYAKAGAADLNPGQLTIGVNIVANHEDIAFATAGAVGDRTVSITIGATAVTASQYTNGYLVIIDDTGEGHTHLITDHGITAGSEAIDISIEPGLTEATVVATTVALVRNLYQDIIISNTDQNDIPTGVPQVTITAEYYGWVQTGGICGVLMDESVANGLQLTIGSSTAGSVELVDANAEIIVGIACGGVNAQDGEYNPIHLSID